MRRKGKFDDKRRERYLGALAAGMRRGKAARAAGVDRETVRRHARDDPTFAEQINLAEESACDQVEDALFTLAVAGNVRACVFWLENRSPERWAPKAKGAQQEEPTYFQSVEEMAARLRAELDRLKAEEDAANVAQRPQF